VDLAPLKKKIQASRSGLENPHAWAFFYKPGRAYPQGWAGIPSFFFFVFTLFFLKK